MNVDVLLCFELPFLTDELYRDWVEHDNPKDREKNMEKRTDLLATMLALYPNKDTSEISKQLGISEKRITTYASMFGVKKSKEFRSEVNRKNGGRSNPGKPIEKVARNGRVVATYTSTKEAAQANGISDRTIRYCCTGKQSSTRGYKYRYKKSLQTQVKS